MSEYNETFYVCGLDWRILSRGDNSKEKKKKEVYSLQEKLFLNENSKGYKPNFA